MVVLCTAVDYIFDIPDASSFVVGTRSQLGPSEVNPELIDFAYVAARAAR